MATHFSILAWEIPWTEKPGGLQSMGSQRVGHNYACTHTSHTLECKLWEDRWRSDLFFLMTVHWHTEGTQ